MKRIIVIGSPGAGKSVFASKLNEKTGLPLTHLDLIWHKTDKTNISRVEFDRILAEIMRDDAWIIDGNYLRTMKVRLEHCDTVFLLDFPSDVCMAGAVERIGKARCDMPWVEDELDEELRLLIENFPTEQLPKIYELLNMFSDRLNIVIFKSREEADFYLKSL